MDKRSPRIFATESNRVESAAVDQLERTASLPGMLQAIGLPDIHPGKGGSPVGAALITEGIVYPYLIGSDIGCGVRLTKTDLLKRTINLDKLEKKLYALGDVDPALVDSVRPSYNVEATSYDAALGTIGLGNHFAELQTVERIENAALAEKYSIESDRLYLTVHSGSRGYGGSILREHVDRFRDDGLQVSSPDFADYIAKHDNALGWAEANRELITLNFLNTLRASGSTVLDISHNFMERIQVEGEEYWLHRKGAAPADKGPVLIPGSRGALSYLVLPENGSWDSGYSIAHGAGRKWDRGSAKGRIQEKYKKKELLRTALGSRVICTDQNLLYEEAPDAYKNVDTVVGDLVHFGLVKVIATFRPLITFKTNEEMREK